MMKLKGNNKGLSLVELMIALVIGSILVVGIGSIMIVSSRSFSSTSAEAAMQSSAQIVMDHIQDVLLDANQKVTYSYTTSTSRPTDESGWITVTKDAEIPDPESAITFKRLSVYTFNLNQVSSPDAFNQEENKHYEIIWEHDTTDDENSVIVFEQQDLAYDPGLNDIVETGGTLESEKLADNVTSFKCDLSDMEKKRIIYVEMDFSKSNGRYTYHVANNISLRNKVALSTDSISVNRSITLETMPLTAEPGMDLPLSIRRIITTGNASNAVTYELDGGDGGRTSASTEVTGPATLHIDATERAEIIKMNAVDSMGDRHPFDVYINRVKWTDDNAASLGESDDVEGIQLIDRPEDDEVDAGTVVPITARLNSNPGAPGIDRTRPEKVTAVIKSITPATAADIKLEEAGNLSWMLDVPGSVHKDTKIKIRFTADHSLADGGIATRTIPYPETDGVYKEIELTVTEAGVAVTKSPFLRGMRGRVIYPEYLEQFFNEAGKSEWEQYKRIPQGTIDNHYLVWKAYASRAAVDGSKNRNYPSNSSGWTVYDAGAVDEKYDDLGGYQGAGWNVINGGKEGNFHGSEFASLDPDKDVGIVFAVLVQYKQNNVTKWFTTSPAQTMLYGFREMISREGSYRKSETQYDLGSFYKLDTEKNNNDIRDKVFGNPDGNTWFVWQKEPCFDNLSFGGNDGGLSISTYLSDTAFSGGSSIGSKNNVEEYWGGEPYTGNHDIFMARVLPMKEIKNKINQNMINNLSDSEKEYFIWPKFVYNNTSFDRTSGYLEFKVKQGNITLKNSANASNRMEGFVPYPAYTTDNGFEIDEHPDFYGKGYGLDSVYKNVGQKTIWHYNNSNYTGNIKKNDQYTCMMKVEDGVYYLRINGLADYKFDKSTERWEFLRADKVEANLISGLYANNNTEDVYLPGPDDEEFFTGFKDIERLANSEKRFASRMAIYKVHDGVAMLDDYKIAYYRKDSKFWVDIYTLDNKNLYKSYSYNETTKKWESKGDMFTVNITETYNDRGTRRRHDIYLPTKNDIEWFNYQQATSDTLANGIMRYQKVNGSWSRLPAGDKPTIYYRYNTTTNDLRINICYWSNDPRIYKYDFVNNKWNRVNGWN